MFLPRLLSVTVSQALGTIPFYNPRQPQRGRREHYAHFTDEKAGRVGEDQRRLPTLSSAPGLPLNVLPDLLH